MATASEILRYTRKLIDTPQKWVKGEASGNTPTGEECFCMIGAKTLAVLVLKPDNKDNVIAYNSLRSAVARLRGVRTGVVSFNDAPETTHEMVMEAMDLAITLAEKEDASCATP